jgi:CO dehydrogenase/acetyl-CoA synthase alpha subunit
MAQTAFSHPDYERVQIVLACIARWIAHAREARRARREFRNCGPAEVAGIARDLGLNPDELITLAKKAPDASDCVHKLLAVLGIDGKALDHDAPGTMRDLRRLCSTCAHKRRCEHDLASGVIAGSFHDYCPNAFTLQSLTPAKQ